MREIILKDGTIYSCNGIRNVEFSEKFLMCQIQARPHIRYKEVKFSLESIKNLAEIRNELEKQKREA